MQGNTQKLSQSRVELTDRIIARFFGDIFNGEISELAQDEQVNADLEALKRRLGQASPVEAAERSES